MLLVDVKVVLSCFAGGLLDTLLRKMRFSTDGNATHLHPFR